MFKHKPLEKTGIPRVRNRWLLAENKKNGTTYLFTVSKIYFESSLTVDGEQFNDIYSWKEVGECEVWPDSERFAFSGPYLTVTVRGKDLSKNGCLSDYLCNYIGNHGWFGSGIFDFFELEEYMEALVALSLLGQQGKVL